MASGAGLAQQPGQEHGGALAARVTHAVVGDGLGAGVAQAAAECLAGSVAVGAVDLGEGRRIDRAGADVVGGVGGEFGLDAAQVQVDLGFCGTGQKDGAVVADFGHRRLQRQRGVVDAVASV